MQLLSRPVHAQGPLLNHVRWLTDALFDFVYTRLVLNPTVTGVLYNF